MEFTRLWMINKSNIMSFHTNSKKLSHPLTVRRYHLFTKIEAKDIPKQLPGTFKVRSIKQTVIKPLCSHSLQVTRPGLGVFITHTVTPRLLFAREEFKVMP